jgi:peptidoglycan/LPS O-acetylase OafA/YrhL
MSDGTARIRLGFLDGLRGLAALYVLLGHAYVAIREPVDAAASPALLKLLKLIDAGHFAVAVFIVLSGYLLMLPVARRADRRIPGGTGGYLRRRARRILPTYYAALALSAGLLLAFPWLLRPGDLTWGSILWHAALLHNLSPRWVQSINGPMWSVALEWQIYFLLPLVLLPLMRRWGAAAALAAGVALGLAPHFLLPANANFDWTYPWYIGLFALGAAGAVVNVAPTPAAAALRAWVPWGLIAGGLGALTLFILLFRLRWAWEYLWLTDLLLGLTVTCAIVYLARMQLALAAGQGQGSTNAPAQLALRVLDSRAVAGLGRFSYSMYLIHEPLLRLTAGFLLALGLPAPALFAAQFLLAVPLVIGLCYLFYLPFERPFVRHAGRPPGRAGQPGTAPLPAKEPVS